MANFVDGFVFPIKKVHLNTYRVIVPKVAEIWKSYGALDYFEHVYDDLAIEGTRRFDTLLSTSQDETVVFGWVTFESRESRDMAHKNVATDKKMADLVAPLMDSEQPIFDAKRMIYGGFKSMMLKK